MRTIDRRRDPGRETRAALLLALRNDEELAPVDVAMFDDLGACLVTSVRDAGLDDRRLLAGERLVDIEVELFAYGNTALDVRAADPGQ